MQGLEAITAHNGWAMAATGACIVIAGLSVLSVIISQLHKIIAILEKKATGPKVEADTAQPVAELKHAQTDDLSDLQATAKLIQPFTVELGSSFKLAELYKTMDKANFPHPHITVRELKGAGYLTPGEEGTFTWNNV